MSNGKSIIKYIGKLLIIVAIFIAFGFLWFGLMLLLVNHISFLDDWDGIFNWIGVGILLDVALCIGVSWFICDKDKKITLKFNGINAVLLAIVIGAVFALTEVVPSVERYLLPYKVHAKADYVFEYSNAYTEQNLIPYGSKRYIMLDEMKLYWEKGDSFGRNGLREIEFLNLPEDYIVVLEWDGNDRVKRVWAYAREEYPNNILDICMELDDGTILTCDGNFYCM